MSQVPASPPCLQERLRFLRRLDLLCIGFAGSWGGIWGTGGARRERSAELLRLALAELPECRVEAIIDAPQDEFPEDF